MKKNTKHLEIQTRKYMDSLFVGNFKSAFYGRGIEFRDFREYTPNDDAKYIDWIISGREGKTIMRRYREDKEGTILCVVNNSESLYYRNAEKYKLTEEILSMIGNASLKSGGKYGGYVINKSGNTYIKPSNSKINFNKFKISENNSHENVKMNLEFLQKNPLKKSIIFIISDGLEIDEKSYKIAALKHDVIYLHISSHFENTLEGSEIMNLRGNTGNFGIDLGNTKKKKEYIKARQKQLSNFAQKLQKIGIDSAFFDENTSLYTVLLQLMKKRSQSR